MKNSIIYLALIGGLVLTTSLQQPKAPANTSFNSTQVVAFNNPIEDPEFVDESIENYAKLDTKEKLYAEFGADNIKDGVITNANQSTSKTSTLTDPRNGKIYNYVWESNGESLQKIEAYYRVIKANKKEKQRQIVDLKDGIFTGMAVEELEKWNKAPFKFAGLSRDGGGLVTFETTKGYDIIVKIGLDASLKQKVPNSIKNKKMISSDSRAVKKYPLFVDYIALKMK